MAAKAFVKMVKVIDHEGVRVLQEARKTKDSFTKVGLPQKGEIGPAESEGSGHELLGDMSELTIVAAVHEFGSLNGDIRERSFLRTAYDENLDKLKKFSNKELKKIFQGKSTVKKALDALGIFHTNQVRRKLTLLKEPPLADETIKRKKSSNPLIDRGQLRQSIQHITVVK